MTLSFIHSKRYVLLFCVRNSGSNNNKIKSLNIFGEGELNRAQYEKGSKDFWFIQFVPFVFSLTLESLVLFYFHDFDVIYRRL